MSKQIWPISLDLGNALAKGVRHGREPVVFPNQLASNRNNVLKDFVSWTSSDPLILEMAGEKWAVGDAAQDLSRTPRAQVGYARYDSPDFQVLMAGMLAELYPAKSGTLAVTFSLPVDGFGQAAEQVKKLSGRWEFVARGKALDFDVPAELMRPVPEAFGSVAYFMLSQDGLSFVDLELAESRVACIDVGGYTTDVLTFRELDLTPVHGSIERGMLQVLGDVNTAIKREFRRKDVDRRDLESIIRTGTYKHRGEAQDVSQFVEEALWELTSGVLAFYTDESVGLAGGVDWDALIFTGGGSPLIRPYLEQKMEEQGVMHHNVLRVPDEHAHLANAMGAYRFAAFRKQYQT